MKNRKANVLIGTAAVLGLFGTSVVVRRIAEEVDVPARRAVEECLSSHPSDSTCPLCEEGAILYQLRVEDCSYNHPDKPTCQLCVGDDED